MPVAAGRAHFGRGDLAASLVVAYPLLLVYAIGILLVGQTSGADLISSTIFRACGRSVPVYLTFYAALSIVVLWWIRRRQLGDALALGTVGPVLLEAAIYAATIAIAVHGLVAGALGLGVAQRLGPTLAPLVISAGAGLHEELGFRLGLCTLVMGLGRRAGASSRGSVIAAITLSSLAFAAAHHLGARGEPWLLRVFVLRTVTGALLALIYRHRSLAHAIYAHALYDLAALWLLG